MEKDNKKLTHVVAAVDIVVFKVEDNTLKALFIKAVSDSYIGLWALPGGMMMVDENIDEAVRRHLKNKTGLSEDTYYEQIYTFGEIDRDPRGRTVSIAHMALVENKDLKLSPSVEWIDVKKIIKEKLAFDHLDILKLAIERLKSKLEYTNIAKNILPKEFTLTELQNVYETILDKEIDKRNFRKKILALNILNNTEKKSSLGAHRPAELYEFKSKKTIIINIL